MDKGVIALMVFAGIILLAIVFFTRSDEGEDDIREDEEPNDLDFWT